MPLWILLLALLPLTGMGVLPCLSGATLLSGAVVVLDHRRRARREADAAAPGARGPRARRPMGALGGAGVALAVVALLAYVLFVVRAA